MKSFADRLREDRRLVLLRLLSEQRQYRTNSSILHMGLEHLGVVASRDDVRTDLAWLAEQGLVHIEDALATVDVVTLTRRGQDVARGASEVPGVSRPSPR